MLAGVVGGGGSGSVRIGGHEESSEVDAPKSDRMWWILKGNERAVADNWKDKMRIGVSLEIETTLPIDAEAPGEFRELLGR